MFVRIKNIIGNNLIKIGAKSILDKENVKKKFNRIINVYYGNEISERIKVISLKNKALLVQCPDSMWAGELQLKNHLILKEFAKGGFKKLIEKIRFIY